MMSISSFKAHFHQVFRLMRDTNMYVDVHNHGRVYRITIEDMHQKVKFRSNQRNYAKEIKTEKCPLCNKLQVNGVCMNANCPSAV